MSLSCSDKGATEPGKGLAEEEESKEPKRLPSGGVKGSGPASCRAAFLALLGPPLPYGQPRLPPSSPGHVACWLQYTPQSVTSGYPQSLMAGNPQMSPWSRDICKLNRTWAIYFNPCILQPGWGRGLEGTSQAAARILRVSIAPESTEADLPPFSPLCRCTSSARWKEVGFHPLLPSLISILPCGGEGGFEHNYPSKFCYEIPSQRQKRLVCGVEIPLSKM